MECRLRRICLADHTDLVLHQQLKQLQRLHVRPAQEEFQTVKIEMAEINRAIAAQANTQRALRTALA